MLSEKFLAEKEMLTIEMQTAQEQAVLDAEGELRA